ncbi:MAG TPA: hypothetical protein PKB13_08795 [Clostridia bacterium]|nr:hypothetical protein [Clostridia bacterium]
MERITKFKALSKGTSDAAADIDLINQYSKRQLSPDEVYVFSLVLCDNDVDRDTERFTNETLEQLAPLFLGKTGISDHRWSSEKQHSRIYRTSVETDTSKKNKLGEPVVVLRADAYMMRTEDTKSMVDAIDGGILKEISVGCQVAECNCSICKEPLRFDWRTGTEQCSTGHIKGQKYDGKLCVGNLEKPTDAYEFSFVAVPSQKRAGVIKGVENVDDAIELLKTADLSQHTQQLKELLPAVQMAFVADDEREKRAKIAADAKARLKPSSN